MSNDVRTLRDWIDWGAAKLSEAGVDEPRLNARRLLIKATDFSSTELITEDQSPLNDADAAGQYKAMIERRAKREPLQHIEGEASFYGYEFWSDGRALIPRADSEVLVEQVIARIPAGEARQVADLGTGSGCLLASVLLERLTISGHAIEASWEAAELAAKNFDRHALSDRVDFFHGSWTDWCGWGEVDLVLSNPPYIETSVLGTLEPEVRDYDPLSALDGGADGLVAYREIVGLAAANMKPGSWLCVEIGFDQKAAVTALFEHAGFQEIAAYQDLGSQDRIVCGRMPR